MHYGLLQILGNRTVFQWPQTVPCTANCLPSVVQGDCEAVYYCHRSSLHAATGTDRSCLMNAMHWFIKWFSWFFSQKKICVNIWYPSLLLKRCRVLKFTLKLYENMLTIKIILADDLAQQMQQVQPSTGWYWFGVAGIFCAPEAKS